MKTCMNKDHGLNWEDCTGKVTTPGADLCPGCLNEVANQGFEQAAMEAVNDSRELEACPYCGSLPVAGHDGLCVECWTDGALSTLSNI
jgi:hypothetical protein